MALFKTKPDKKSPEDEAAQLAADLFDETYKEELRNYGREYFRQVIDKSTANLKNDVDASIAGISQGLKEYMLGQLDATVARINSDLTRHLDRRLAEYDRVTREAQDLAVQSLNRNAHALHEKYQQLSQTLQQTIASQEAMMITVFEENRARMASTQSAQESVMSSLNDNVESSRQQSKQLKEKLEQSVAQLEADMRRVLEESKARIDAANQAQDSTLKTLSASASNLESQYQQLSDTIQKSVDQQKDMMVGAFTENMARIIEHYLLEALGDQYDVKAQLPGIIEQLQQNKQVIADDMKL